ncbi:MAG TPA: aminopeptidase P family protein [Fermentimonas caenicola]|jgi:Xaa-Pro aminopeptidase|uniref:aminopeptidase P family protein n=1 Tax=Lascolabacillus sp. TaxID=1924068 RepID=UPI001821FA70|nr:aminopeptidase P family protein [Lascolabacillus sp.]MBP7104164.1 aminopeptidase P family protein [Fermentimonas sp.]MDI9625965.1 aminopeptidase P family protein [Bacteroidota bacterium]HHU42465.1 aminopeptidase P family protein [Fermentimonas caenicola]MCK9502320.1 aminopeptidase P family protein [Lascolabacillus sp.]MDD2607767.1 aminopeptidase P family protein [Lascolabacillus sp.]
MKTNEIPARLEAMRQFMTEKNLDAFIIPSTDAHLSEYPPKYWESRKWISGFTGSAGTAVVTKEKAGVWTDSRYFIQAAEELKDTGFDLFKMGQPETPDMTDWIIEQVGSGGTVGIDGLVYASSDAKSLKSKLDSKNINLNTEFDPFSVIRTDRPEIPQNHIFTLPVEVAGESVKSKIERINGELKKLEADGIIIVTLDAVAWTFNMRGNDVEYNPVAVAYAYVSENETVLFVDPDKISEEIAEEYKEQGIIISDYNNVFEYVANLPADSKVCVTGNKINWKLLQTIPESCKIVDVPSPVDLMKSIKNETELEGFRNAMIKDGVALVKFYMWLEKAIPTGEVTEVMIEEKLLEYRSQQENFVGESFGTIAGYAGNGAIVHYHATPENCLTIKPEGLLLIDSGGQYKDGTTDITRTVAAGKLTKQMKADYTNVLKGHIALATAIFPEGTRGSQLDVLARKALWNNCLTYWHGTGHGIGHFLNVHEGPQNIRLEENPTLLKPGMVTSNEPGVYRANQYGIRIENLIVTQEYRKTEEFGTFYNFETITLCPIDTRPISKKLLTKCEKKWLNKYHKMVYKKLKNHLSVEEKTWLKNKTKPI